ncbi:alpha/beta hydrolase [Sphingomonas sp. So64.6b]|uniref:alpha/beta hydrolase n=1 Tax=Sphingomonas sp. So64.6b TaxID=2997354 RepID=UPI001603E393|nr:alpha/beta hydrolase [Sphingomonas sp. So64.6b]QNA82671.1 alpha/beta hydrolase [Sphingomonas sp. So64.6b]
MSIWIKLLIAIVAIVAALGLILLFASPPGVLNFINSHTPGDGNAEQVADGVAYGTDPAQKLDVWAPRQRADATPLPVVIFYYGGGWVKGSRGEYGFAGRAFAAQGFIAVLPDYRLVPGVRFPVFVQDSALAVKWVRDTIARYGGDPKRITLSGHSAGAYNAAMLALDRHWLTDIGVDPGIVRAAALLAGPYDFYPFEKKRSIDAMSHWPRLLETQPIQFARKDAPPLWLAAGTADDVVRPYNAEHLAKRLKELGAPVTLRLYPGQSHNDLVMGLSKPFRSRSPTLKESSDFLKANSH